MRTSYKLCFSDVEQPAKNSTTQKIWVVTECYYPEVVSTGQCLAEMGDELSIRFEVKVICGNRSDLSSDTRECLPQSGNGVEIFRVRSTALDSNFVWYRMVNMLTFGLAMFWNSFRRFKKGDKVLVITTPSTLPFTAALASLINGASYTLYIRTGYPDDLFTNDTLQPNSLRVQAIHFANAWLFKYAAKIIVVGRDMAEHIKARTNGLDVPISTMPNWKGSSVDGVVRRIDQRP